ncbi:Nonribosomal peptide synthetase gloA [Trichinella spiralis]|uniref:Nonribosomal peptide synthetase gloA n=1 Tax=Trichinella spiralis TaxID=6334 RepID=A0ABR3K764_TRISP
MTERLSACSDGLQPLYKCPATGCPRGYFCENGGCCRRLVSQYHKSDSCPTVQDEDRSKILQSCLINSDCHDNEYCCQGKCVRATKKHATEPDTLRAGLQAARAKRPISCKLGCQGQ